MLVEFDLQWETLKVFVVNQNSVKKRNSVISGNWLKKETFRVWI